MKTMTITMTGDEALRGRLEKILDTTDPAVADALERVGQDLQKESMGITPVLTGDLQGSAFHEVGEAGGKLELTVGYTAPYAARQHEGVSYKHNPPGQAKFLETPLKNKLETYIKNLEAALAKSLESQHTSAPSPGEGGTE